MQKWSCSILNLAHVKRILIVDDSPLMRHSLRTLLERRPQWKVCGEAENGRDAIEKAQQLHPDLIVIDMAMPVLNGIEASKVLKQLMPATPLVMFTTFTDTYIKEEALAAGVHAIIDKSEGHTSLISSIQELLLSTPPSPSDGDQ
jgi:DNA-binding NarL/FixJ family response regulator